MLDVGFVVEALGALPFTVSRRATTWANGLPTTSEASSFTALLNVQPLSASQVQRLPENLRREGAVNVWTRTALRTASEGTSQGGDRFAWNGATYEVQADNLWYQHGGFYAYLANKVIS